MQIPSFTAQTPSNEIPVENVSNNPRMTQMTGDLQTFKDHIQHSLIRQFLVSSFE